MSMYRYAGRPGRARVTSLAVVHCRSVRLQPDAADTTAPDEPAATTGERHGIRDPTCERVSA